MFPRIVIHAAFFVLSVLVTGISLAADNERTIAFEWTASGLEARTIAIASDRAAYALDQEGRAFKLVTAPRTRWFSMNRRFSRLVARPEHGMVWALHPATGLAYRFNRSFWGKKGELPFIDLTVTENGTVLGLTRDHRILEWVDDVERWLTLVDLVQERVTRILAGAGNTVFLLNVDGDVLTLRDGGQTTDTGVTQVVDFTYDQHANALYLISLDGVLRRWEIDRGIEAMVAGLDSAQDVAAGSDGEIWVIDPNGEVLIGREKPPVEEVAVAEDLPVVSATVPTAETQRASAKSDGEPTKPIEGDQDAEPPTFKLSLFRVPDFTADRLAIGQDGRVFALPQNARFFMWNNDRRGFHEFPGSAARAAVGPDGEIWGISNSGEVSFFDGREWKSTGFNEGRGIWLSPEGTVWISTIDEKILTYDRRRKRFNRTKLKGAYFTFDADGRFWTAMEDGKIFRCVDGRCKRVPGHATDIVAGRDNHVLRIGAEGRLFIFNEGRNNWRLIRDGVRAVEFGPGDHPWLADANGTLFASAFFERDESRDFQVAAAAAEILERQARFSSGSGETTSGFTFTKRIDFEEVDLNGGDAGARIMFVGPNDAAFVLGDDFATVWEYDHDDNEFDLFTDLPRTTGTAIRRMAVDDNGRPWIVYADNRLFRPDGKKKYKEITEFSNAAFVDINYNNVVMAVDTSSQLFTYDADKDEFEQFDDGVGIEAGDFSVDPEGDPWIRIGSTGDLREYTGKKFEDRPNNGAQNIDNIGIGGNGDIYVSEQLGGNARLLKYNESNDDFDEVDVPNGVGVLWVDVGGDGRPWFVSTDNRVFRAK